MSQARMWERKRKKEEEVAFSALRPWNIHDISTAKLLSQQIQLTGRLPITLMLNCTSEGIW